MLMTFFMEVLLPIFAAFVGAFGVAAIRLMFAEPRKLAFIAAALTFLALGMKESPHARKVLLGIQGKVTR